MCKKVVLFFFFFCFSAHGKLDFKSCSKNGLKVIYVNGVYTSNVVAVNQLETLAANTLAIAEERKESLDAKEFNEDSFGFSYNPSSVRAFNFENKDGIIRDAWECVSFKMDEYTQELAGSATTLYLTSGAKAVDEFLGTDVSSEIEDYVASFKVYRRENSAEVREARVALKAQVDNSLLDQKKVILLAYSQGSFLAREVSNEINGESHKIYGAVFLGTPINNLPPSPDTGRFSYLSLKEDPVVRGAWLGGALPWNAELESTDDISVETHVGAYFENQSVFYEGKSASMSDHIYNKLKDVVKTLANNDPGCCNKRDGKLWMNEIGCSGISCLGGFLEKTVKIASEGDDKLTVDADSQLCGAISADTQNSELKLANTKIKGPAVLKGEMELTNVNLDATSTTSLFSGALLDAGNDRIEISLSAASAIGANILGRPQIEGGVRFISNQNAIAISEAEVFPGDKSKSAYSSEMGVKIKKATGCQDFQISNSKIRGNTLVDACGAIYNDTLIRNAEVKGNVNFDNARLLGQGYMPGVDRLRVHADSLDGIVIRQNVTIQNNPLLSGSMIIQPNTTIQDSGTYSGVTQVLHDEERITSSIGPGLYKAANNLSGLYFVNASLQDVTVMGEYAELSSPQDWTALLITSTAQVGQGATVKGIGRIEGIVGVNTTVHGKDLGSSGGVYMEPGSQFVGVGKTLQGGVYLDSNSSILNASVNATLWPNGNFTTFENSTISGGAMTGGYGALEDSSVIDSLITAGSGFYLEDATVSNSTITGSAYLCPGVYNDGYYDSDFDCLEETDMTTFRAKTRTIGKQVREEVRAHIKRGFISR